MAAEADSGVEHAVLAARSGTSWLRGIVELTGLSALSALAGYLARALLARTLSVDDFGLFYAFLALISILLVFSNLGLLPALVRQVPALSAQHREPEARFTLIATAGISLGVAGLICFSLVLIRRPLAERFFHRAGAEEYMTAFAALFLLLSVYRLFWSVFNARQQPGSMGRLELAHRVLLLFGIAYLFLRNATASVADVGLVYVAMLAIVLLLFSPLVLRTSGLRDGSAGPSVTALRALLQFAGPSLAGMIGYIVLRHADTLLLMALRDLEDVGIYNAVLPAAMAPLILGSSVAFVLLPRTAELWSSGATERLQELIRVVHKYVLLSLVPAVLMLSCFPELVLRLLFGSAFSAGAPALAVLAPGLLLAAMFQINHAILQGIHRPRAAATAVAAAVGVSLCLDLALIPSMGVSGAAVAHATAYLVGTGITIRALRRSLDLRVRWFDLGRIAAASLAFLGLVQLSGSRIEDPLLGSGVGLLLAAAGYAGVIFVSGLVSRAELAILVKGR